MIVCMWHGRTPSAKAHAYAEFLNLRALPDYRSVPGNLGAHALRREEGAVTHFVTLSFWDDEEAVRAFAGAEFLTAKYYPEDADFLLEFEPEVQHYQITSSA